MNLTSPNMPWIIYLLWIHFCNDTANLFDILINIEKRCKVENKMIYKCLFAQAFEVLNWRINQFNDILLPLFE